jgi:anion-transporting  ArsA/GET3 family ATPase
MDITAFYAHSPVLIVVGKGGVGKTTASAALARLAARNGLSVLLVELEKRSGRSATLDGHLLTRDERNEVEPSAAGSGDGRTRPAQIRARTLTPGDALAEYLIDHGLRRVAKRLVDSGMLDLVATGVPGVRDVLVLGQIVRLEQAGVADLIVVDGPAAGHATTFLTSAHGLRDSSRAGPMRTRAAEVVEFLSDSGRCRVVLVALAEQTPVNETVEAAFMVEDRVGAALAPVIVNGVYPRLDHLDADPEDAAAAAGVTLRPGQADAVRAAATFRRRRQEMQAEQAARLASALPLPQLGLPHLFTEEIGLPELDLLADALERGLVDLREPAESACRTGPTGPAARHRVAQRAAVYDGLSS